MKVLRNPVLIGMAVGLACSIPLLCLVATSAFGVYETHPIARALFPYAGAIESDGSPLIPSSLFLQYPFHGAVLGLSWGRKTYRCFTLIITLVLIAGCHVAAVRVADEANARWVESLRPQCGLNPWGRDNKLSQDATEHALGADSPVSSLYS